MHADESKEIWWEICSDQLPQYPSLLPNNLVSNCLVFPLFPHLHTRLAHLCSGPACTALAQHWPWPGSATVPSTSSILVWSAIQRNTAVFSMRWADSCFKASLCLCRLIRRRLKSTSVHSPGKEKKKRLRSTSYFCKPSPSLGEYKCCMQSNRRDTDPPDKVFTHAVLESNHLNFWSYSID